MPEGPELCLAARFVSTIGQKYQFGGAIVRSDVSLKNPLVPFQAEEYKIWSESRGKEMKVFLEDVREPNNRTHILFRFGMSGCFKFTAPDDLPKHSHLRFSTLAGGHILSFVDYRRFGRWEIEGQWGKDRGPDAVREYEKFRSNVLGNLTNSAFNKPICEVLMNQKYFNGIGNYLRAEILYRGGIPPFDGAREVLEGLQLKSEADPSSQIKSDVDPGLQIKSEVDPSSPIKSEVDPSSQSKAKVEPSARIEAPDILELCRSIQQEVLTLGGGKGYDVNHNPEDEANFMKWLQCYYQEGMENLVDANKRTVWFSGHPGKLAPKNGISRGKIGAGNSKGKKPAVKGKVKTEAPEEVSEPAIKRVKLAKAKVAQGSPRKLRSRSRKAVD